MAMSTLRSTKRQKTSKQPSMNGGMFMPGMGGPMMVMGGAQHPMMGNPMMGNPMMGNPMMMNPMMMGGHQMMGNNPMMMGAQAPHDEDDTSEDNEVGQQVQQQPMQQQGQPTVPVADGIAQAAVARVMQEGDSFLPGCGPSGNYNKCPDAMITRSASTLRNLPRNRLSEALEAICPVLESGYTAELSISGCLMLLWILTRMKPLTKICDLRILDLSQYM